MAGLLVINHLGVTLRLYWDNGTYNGNYYLGFRVKDLAATSPTSRQKTKR